MIKRNIILVSVLTCMFWAGSSFALVGAGIQWGFDFTLKMDDSFDNPMGFKNKQPLPLRMIDSIPNLSSVLPVSISIDSLKQLITDNSKAATSLPFTLSRSGWTRSVINFGGKVFIDAIPVIDAIEASFNMGAWEYEAVMKYPSGEVQDNITEADINAFLKTGNYEKLIKMNEVPLTLEQFDLGYLKMFGLTQTPYFKANIDVSIRKNLIAVPKNMKTFKLYLGGGATMHIGTPVITPEFVSDIMDSKILGSFLDSTKNSFTNISGLGSTDPKNALMKSIMEAFIDQAKKPTFGMHILAGTMIKFPVIPLGIFADFKYMIPFGDMDKNVDLGGFGFLINAGICLSL